MYTGEWICLCTVTSPTVHVATSEVTPKRKAIEVAKVQSQSQSQPLLPSPGHLVDARHGSVAQLTLRRPPMYRLVDLIAT
jgi:hypothetical protein